MGGLFTYGMSHMKAYIYRGLGWGGGGVGITANTKILGHLTASIKKFAVTVKINE